MKHINSYKGNSIKVGDYIVDDENDIGIITDTRIGNNSSVYNSGEILYFIDFINYNYNSVIFIKQINTIYETFKTI